MYLALKMHCLKETRQLTLYFEKKIFEITSNYILALLALNSEMFQKLGLVIIKQTTPSA